MRDDRSDAPAVRRVYLVVLAIPLVMVAAVWIVQGLVIAALARFGMLFALAFLMFGTRRGAVSASKL